MPRYRLLVLLPLLLLGLLTIGILFSRLGLGNGASTEGTSNPQRPKPQPDLPFPGETVLIPPAAEPVHRPANPEAYVNQVLREILPKYRQAMSNRRPHFTGALQAQEEIHYREARLLALAYPREMESLLSKLANDTSLDRWERLCCIDLLGDLANIGLEPAQVTLAHLTKGSEVGLSSAALRNLACSDPKGEYFELYRSKCHELVRDAFDAVSYYGDPATIKQLEVIYAKSLDKTSPEAQVRLAAQWTIQKINILSSPGRDQVLLSLLDGSKNEKDWFTWAVQVAKNRSTPGMTEALRRRLDRTEKSLFDSSGNPDSVGLDMTADFVRGSTSGIGDSYFDEALIAYAESGGKLTEPERQRLYRAGYACDPKKRLEELLSTGR